MTTPSLIKQLNARLGESLGYVRGGMIPRWCWLWAPDVPYWASRLGKSWVLCQWKRPGMPEQEWQRHFQGKFPYPENGMHHAMPETLLRPGELPTPELTQNYIWAIDLQMSRTYGNTLSEINSGIDAEKEQQDTEWVDYIQDQNPAFSNFASGDRGNHVSFGGI